MLAAIVLKNRLSVETIVDPTPLAHEALVRVAASSVNQGEVKAIRSQPHWVLTSSGAESWSPGWDFAGIVERAADNGSGHPTGTRVVGWTRQGAWAEKLTAPADQMVAIPDELGFAEAATLPIAGLTAWHALRVGGLAAGKSVLVTGATGGVGRFAIQLACIAGAHAIAVMTSASRVGTLEHFGCDVAIGMPEQGNFDIILECVGGASLATAMKMVAPYGAIVSYGNASGESTTFEAGAAFRKPCLTLHSFALHDELARRPSNAEGLDTMVEMLVAGQLKVDIALTKGLREVADACDALMARKVEGKAVLLIGE
jgi:NADPH:quinone reductase